jgi:hypothetical protein
VEAPIQYQIPVNGTGQAVQVTTLETQQQHRAMRCIPVGFPMPSLEVRPDVLWQEYGL